MESQLRHMSRVLHEITATLSGWFVFPVSPSHDVHVTYTPPLRTTPKTNTDHI